MRITVQRCLFLNAMQCSKYRKCLKVCLVHQSYVYGICHKYAKFSKVLVLEQYAYYSLLNLQMNFQIAQAQGIPIAEPTNF